MKILCTGGGGFLGQHVVADLDRHGHNVIVVDPAGQGVLRSGDAIFERIEHATNIPDFDVAIHLAAPVGTYGVVRHAGTVASQIMASTSAVLDLCAARDAKLINVSTSEVYGFDGYYRESAVCEVPPRHSPRLAYAVGKLAAEQDVHSSGVDARTIRPFNMAGPGQNHELGFVVPRWCRQLLDGVPLTVFGDGLYRRTFCHVHDFCDLIGLYLDRWDDIPTVVNAGNPANETSMIDLARRFQDVVAQDPSADVPLVEFVDGRDVFGLLWEEAAGHDKIAVIDRAHQIGWNPKRSLDSIIRDTLVAARDRAGR